MNKIHTSSGNIKLQQRRDFILKSGAAAVLPALLLTPGISNAATSLEKALATRAFGDPNAPIKMAEYFSLSCSHCADFHRGAFKDIKTNWIDTGKIYFEMRDFPLQGPAVYAHALARSVPINAYGRMLDILFERQREWVTSNDPISSLAQIAKIAGIGNDAFVEIIQNRPLLEGIVAIAQNGYQRWNINSTPSFVLNDDEVIRGNAGYDHFLSIFNKIAT